MAEDEIGSEAPEAPAESSELLVEVALRLPSERLDAARSGRLSPLGTETRFHRAPKEVKSCVAAEVTRLIRLRFDLR